VSDIRRISDIRRVSDIRPVSDIHRVTHIFKSGKFLWAIKERQNPHKRKNKSLPFEKL
jgi:hypothetical protein